ncbi:MAG: 2-hydroxyacid dehydrogenase, partial [Bacteroidetes bacterium]|nr:2-hydroxyacid dehydrogenase [Bacteroidota bacterium]
AKSCQAVSLFTSDKADASVLQTLAGYGVKYIALRSVGFDHVDLKEAKRLQMQVANVPAYSPHSVAEHAVTLLMTLNRKILLSQELMRVNDFRLDGLTGFDVHEKKIGIVGIGKIGETFARIMNGFGCELLCYDPCPRHELEVQLNIRFVDLAYLCTHSDVISIHCPLNKTTTHLFNKELFSIMKKGVFVINTARGPIINTQDLMQALDAGIVGAAGLDVYEFEKGLFFHDHSSKKTDDQVFQKLRLYKNVLITGHQAFLTETALKNIAQTTAYNLNCFAKGALSINALEK